MNQAALTSLVSKLSVRVRREPRKFSNPEGLYGRLKSLRKTVTALVRHERIEVKYVKGDEARGYAERLISEAVRYGDCHKPTMDLAKFWVDDPALVPKLFKVLVPRYKNWPQGLPYTRMLRMPANPVNLKEQDLRKESTAVLEFRGNPYPPLPGPVNKKHPGAIHNVLLEEARKDYFRSQTPIAVKAETLIGVLPEPESSEIDTADHAEAEVEPGKDNLSSQDEQIIVKGDKPV